MKTACSLLLVASALLAGCGNNASKTPSPTNSASGNPLNAPGDYLGAMGKAHEAAIKTVDLGAVRQAIQMFKVDKDRNPKDLNELLQGGEYLSRLPEAPYGMKLDYDAASGTVKIVKQ